MKKNTSISMITSGHPVAVSIIIGVYLTSLCLIGCAGCGGVKETQIDKVTITSPAQKALTHDSIVHIKQLVKDDAKVQISKSGAQVIQNDSVYAIIFRNDDGDSVGYYDIWKNNPFDDLPFDRIQEYSYKDRKQYSVPGLRKSLLRDKVDYEFLKQINIDVEINLIVNITKVTEIGSDFMGVCYILVALEGYPEEDTNQGIYSIVKVVNKYGEAIQSIKIPAKAINRGIAISQDGKYLVYLYSTEENNEGCFDILDLNKKEVLLSHCAEKGKDLRGAGISKDGYSILLTSQDLSSPRMKPVELFVFNSLDGKLYYKKDNPDAQYGGLMIEGDYFKFLAVSPSGNLTDEIYQISKDFKVLKQLK